MTGRTLGEGHKERIDQTAFTFQIMFCIIGVFTGLIILLSRGPVLQIYNTLSPEAAELTRQFITVLAITSSVHAIKWRPIAASSAQAAIQICNVE